jgi:hypothetical protein
MAAKPRKSVVQNIIKNLLEMEIPEIQTASKELGEWIKQLEQHSFKLQHYATEIETWAAEEEDGDSVELTDLIKDLEATLSDMRKGGAPSLVTDEALQELKGLEKPARGYGTGGRVLKEQKALPKAEIKGAEEKAPARQAAPVQPPAEEVVKREPARTPQGVLIAKDVERPAPRAELHSEVKEVVKRDDSRTPATPVEEDDSKGYMTPEGFLIRRLRP